MYLKQNRLLPTLANAAANLVLGAAPAMAGEDDDEAPAAPAKVPSTSSSSVSGAPQGDVGTGAGSTALPRDRTPCFSDPRPEHWC